MKIPPLRTLPLKNDFMFGQVMRRETVCKLFLEAVLGKKIDHIEFTDRQKDLSDSYYSHGIRLDVYLKDASGTVYDVEMQTTNSDYLEKRIRFYQSGIDRDILDKGAYYTELSESYIIFVCDFDYYRKGLAVYERVSRIKGTDQIYEDGSHVLILNSHYQYGNTGEAVLEYLDYIRTNDDNRAYQTSLLNEVRKEIEAVRTDERMEGPYMTFAMKLQDQYRAGQQQGHQEGIQEGHQEERRRIAKALLGQMTIAQIAKITQLSEEEVSRLKS